MIDDDDAEIAFVFIVGAPIAIIVFVVWLITSTVQYFSEPDVAAVAIPEETDQ